MTVCRMPSLPSNAKQSYEANRTGSLLYKKKTEEMGMDEKKDEATNVNKRDHNPISSSNLSLSLSVI